MVIGPSLYPLSSHAASAWIGSTCPACGSRNLDSVLSLNRVPVNCSALWPNRSAARECAKGSIELRSCSDCELTFNAAFDRRALEYDTNYDNSLDFSQAFQTYAEELAGELVASYDLRAKRIVEIGCGNGYFLKLLCQLGNNVGIGYDPSFPFAEQPIPGVKFIRGYFNKSDASQTLDFLCCRHVLEHLEHPFEFLLDLSETRLVNPDASMYFEVPNAEFVLAGDGLWDVIYPHVSYFNEASLINLFKRAGYTILRSGKRFSDQYLFVEVRAQSGSTRNQRNKSSSSRGFRSSTSAFRSRLKELAERWSSYLAQFPDRIGRPLAFWGAGAKGVTFLNLVNGATRIPAVVDSNPRKQGMFIPGTGQRISSPDALKEMNPAAVILLNSVYRDEIKAFLRGQGITAPLVSHPGEFA